MTFISLSTIAWHGTIPNFNIIVGKKHNKCNFSFLTYNPDVTKVLFKNFEGIPWFITFII